VTPETHRYGGRSIPPTATASITTAAGTGNPRLGFVDRKSPAVVLLLVQSLDRRLSLGVRAHLDKTEPLTAARVTVWGASRCQTLGGFTVSDLGGFTVSAVMPPFWRHPNP
jgi:hypothetical protein